MTKPTPLCDVATDRTIPWPVFAVTVAGAFMVALDLSIVNVAFPSIEASFPSVSTATLSWVLSAYSVVFGALLLGAGRIADRSGRRRSFQRGLAVFTLGSALCGLAPPPGCSSPGAPWPAAPLLMPASFRCWRGHRRRPPRRSPCGRYLRSPWPRALARLGAHHRADGVVFVNPPIAVSPRSPFAGW
jgi:hypothetical protein